MTLFSVLINTKGLLIATTQNVTPVRTRIVSCATLTSFLKIKHTFQQGNYSPLLTSGDDHHFWTECR